ncbi:hypothetical protein ACTXT7_017019 [Hymenolepis weldensis]
MYARISASASKHVLNCSKETVSILLNVLSDDCARLYDQRLDESVLIPVLTTLPLSWFSRPKFDESEIAASEDQAEEIVIILKYLYLISQSNVKTTEWLLTLQFNLTAIIAVLLFYGIDEVTQGCVLCLLDSIISNIKKPENTTALYESGIFALKCYRLSNNIAFTEALVSEDKVKLAQIAAEYSTDIGGDYRNRNPTQWADYLGRDEIKDFIISKFTNLQNYSNDSEIDQSNNLEQLRSGEVQGGKNGQGIQLGGLQKHLHLFYFIAEILLILLVKYHQYYSEIHRYAILNILQKIVKNIPRQMLESIIGLSISGKSIKQRICKIIKEAIESKDNEMSNTALLLNQSLQTTLPSVFTDLARRYYLPVMEEDCNLSQPKRAKYEEFSPMSTHDIESYVKTWVFHSGDFNPTE